MVRSLTLRAILPLWLFVAGSGLGLLYALGGAHGFEALVELERAGGWGRLSRSLHAWGGWWLLGGSLVAAIRGARRWSRVHALAVCAILGVGSGWLLRGDQSSRMGLLVAHGILFAVLPALLLPWRGWNYRPALVSFGLVGLCAFLWPASLVDPRASSGTWVSQTPLMTSRLSLDPIRALESCLDCHASVQGLGAHAGMGCRVCHLGAFWKPDVSAHGGMVLVPGNLDAAEVTCGVCHGEATARVKNSMMARANGIVAVNRWAFGEASHPNGMTPVTETGTSAADTHVRQLCSTCHLGHPKTRPGPVRETSRGGGCTACHLSQRPARTDARSNPASFVHPGLSVRVEDSSCFGCHSRSGRISLGFKGLWESGPSGDRNLEDGRWVRLAKPDVHQERGMSCIDCHTTNEIMGDGARYQHQEDATSIRCRTCHRVDAPSSVLASELPSHSSSVIRLRGDPPWERYLVEDRKGEILNNATPGADGTVLVRGKVDGVVRTARPPGPSCKQPSHERLSCASCHTAHVTRCSGCHTQYDATREGFDGIRGEMVQGAWVEFDTVPEIGPPTLGVSVRDGREWVEPFIPGMIMTLNGPENPAPSPMPRSAASLVGPGTRLVRAFAFAAPHTIRREVRTCAECHLDPKVLGLGAGVLDPEIVGEERIWRFKPKYGRAKDGRVLDAWVGVEDLQGTATRDHQRPFRPDERARVLRVGGCLLCHAGTAPLFDTFGESVLERASGCWVADRLE